MCGRGNSIPEQESLALGFSSAFSNTLFQMENRRPRMGRDPREAQLPGDPAALTSRSWAGVGKAWVTEEKMKGGGPGHLCQ